MADTKVWIGGTSTNPETDANWSPATEIATGDTLIFNDESQQLCDGAEFTAADPGIDVYIFVEESYEFTVGSSGTPLAFNGIKYLKFSGRGTGSSYFATVATDHADLGMDNVVVNSPSAANPCVDLDGTIVRLDIERGKTNLQSGATLSTRGHIQGNRESQLTIPSGCTLSANMWLAVDGGLLDLSTTGINIRQSGGEIALKGTAGAALLDQSGGIFYWDAKSTITLAEISGASKFITRYSRTGRTLTSSFLYGNAIMDVQVGGLNIAFTNSTILYGNSQKLDPAGTALTGSPE